MHIDSKMSILLPQEPSKQELMIVIGDPIILSRVEDKKSQGPSVIPYYSRSGIWQPGNREMRELRECLGSTKDNIREVLHKVIYLMAITDGAKGNLPRKLLPVGTWDASPWKGIVLKLTPHHCYPNHHGPPITDQEPASVQMVRLIDDIVPIISVWWAAHHVFITTRSCDFIHYSTVSPLRIWMVDPKLLLWALKSPMITKGLCSCTIRLPKSAGDTARPRGKYRDHKDVAMPSDK